MIRGNFNPEEVPEMGAVINYIVLRYRKGLGTNIVVTGPSGSGKSYVCERGSELVNKKIKGETSLLDKKHILDTPLNIIEFVKDSSPGSCGNLEEIGSVYNSRRSMVSENVDINRILDTIRKRKLILFCNCPSIKSSDKAFVRHAHIFIEILGVIKSRKICVFKAFKCQYNSAMDKMYRHSFKDKLGHDIRFFYCNLPSDYLIKLYEKSKDSFLDDLYEKIKNRALEKEAKEIKRIEGCKKIRVVKELTEIQHKIFTKKFIEKKKNVVIAKELGIHPSGVSIHLRYIKNKISISEENEKTLKEQTRHVAS